MEEGKMTKLELFEKQKETLDIFLAHGTISKEQYDFSLNGLIKKMNLTGKDIEKQK